MISDKNKKLRQKKPRPLVRLKIKLKHSNIASILHDCHQLWESLTSQFTNLQGQSDLEKDLPKKWEKHGDLILLPQNCFTNPEWHEIDQRALWEAVAQHFGVERIAKKDRICSDGHRTPQVSLLKGEDPWVCHVDNKIRYSYDVTKCMFSIGNITEKMRMAKLDCKDETIVDMFAGIGYFTLPLLVHGKARYVHACEWNADAIQALRKNLVDNKVVERCTVYGGDNRKVCPENVADRVLMGLIPTAMESIRAACGSLKIGSGGILHIHQNVESKINKQNEYVAMEDNISCNKSHVLTEWIFWAKETAQIVKNTMLEIYKEKSLKANIETEIIHIEKVKSYAPRIDHLVLDLKVITHRS
ncbi:tRNA wybutosine-synthesizing protein 2 homolog isoform X1 [Styela clava]